MENRGEEELADSEEHSMEVDPGGPSIYTGCTLFREIRASTVEGKNRNIKLGFEQYIIKTNNWLLKTIFGRMSRESKPIKWMR